MRQVWLTATLAASAILAQTPLTLQDAVRTALARHPVVEVTAAQTRIADARAREARAGYLPRVNYAESWTRSDNPVFVFSSLLTQRQFSESNFQLPSLNRPDFTNNFQSQITADQTLFDWGARTSQVRTAELARSFSQQQERRTLLDLTAKVVRAYYAAALAQASLEVAHLSLKSAEADVQRAESIRDAGMSTDADVLSIRVHLAAVREQEIRRGYDLQVAVAVLNESLGLPLDTRFELSTPLAPSRSSIERPAAYQSAAAQNRPEVRQSELALQIAGQQSVTAKAASLPQFALQAAFEADRGQFVRKGGANFLVSASMRWTLFDGFANRARVAQAQAATLAAQAQQRQAVDGVRLEAFRSWADAKAAEERIAVADASVAQAEESLRIHKNRFANGLTTVTELLRNETAALEARLRRIVAIHDQRVAAAQLEWASGALSADSEILK